MKTLQVFDFKVYNSLPEVEDADQELSKNGGLKECLQKLLEIALKYKLQNHLNARLVHRHHLVSIEDLVVEQEEIRGGKVVLVTRPTKKSLISVPIAPNSYLLIDKKMWQPLEYSADDYVLETHQTLMQNPEFFSDWYDATKQFSLDGLLIPAIAHRKAWHEQTQGKDDFAFLEMSTEVPAESIVEMVSSSVSNVGPIISTAWKFTGETANLCIHCVCHCCGHKGKGLALG